MFYGLSNSIAAHHYHEPPEKNIATSAHLQPAAASCRFGLLKFFSIASATSVIFFQKIRIALLNYAINTLAEQKMQDSFAIFMHFCQK
jgi:hypothetical protein